MVARKIRLGENELRLLFTAEKEGRRIFSMDDARRILRTSEASIWNVIYRLKKKGRIEEIEKGKYLLVPARAGYEGTWSEVPYLLVPRLIDTYYVGFWSALNFWGMTEQVPRTVFVATTKRKRDVNYVSAKFEFVTLAEKRFFGFEEREIGGGKFNVSSKEKTIVDCLLYPKYCGGLDEAVKGIWNARKELDLPKLFGSSKRIGVDVVVRRLGYILELLGLKERPALKPDPRNPRGFMWLDPLGPKRVLRYSKEYGLMVNRTKKELTSWMGR